MVSKETLRINIGVHIPLPFASQPLFWNPISNYHLLWNVGDSEGLYPHAYSIKCSVHLYCPLQKCRQWSTVVLVFGGGRGFI